MFIFQFLKTWRHHCEDITVRWRDEDITVFSFSLYHTWRNDPRLYNRMILTKIIIIMFTYSGIVVIGNPWILICHPQCNEWHCRAANQNPRASNYNHAIINEHYCYNIKLANSVFGLKQNYPCPVKLQDDDLSLCMILNSLNFNPTKWLKKFDSYSRQIVRVCLTILWSWR